MNTPALPGAIRAEDFGTPVEAASLAPGGRGLVRLRNVQALRGVAALAVVIAHMANPKGFESKWLAGDRSWLGWLDPAGQAGVDLFFVISGLIMVVTTSTMAQGLRAAGSFGVRRLVRIFPLYWLVTLPVLVLFLVAPDLVNSSSSAPPRIFESFLLLPQPGLPLLLVGWTLTFELYFYLVFAVTLLLPARWRPVALLGWGVVSAVLAVAIPSTSKPWLALVSSPICLEFLFGATVGWLTIRGIHVLAAPATVMGLVGASVALSLGDDAFPGNWFRVVPVAVLLAVLVYGAVGLEQRHGLAAPRWAQSVGDASYSMYLLHVLVLTALGRFLLIHLPDGLLTHALGLVLSITAVVVASLLSFRLVERPLMRLLHPRRLSRLFRSRSAAHAGAVAGNAASSRERA